MKLIKNIGKVGGLAMLVGALTFGGCGQEESLCCEKLDCSGAYSSCKEDKEQKNYTNKYHICVDENGEEDYLNRVECCECYEEQDYSNYK